MKSIIKVAVATCCTTVLALPVPTFAKTSDYPNKPITLIVPFPAGGTSDVLGRMVGEKLGQALGQTVVVENRAGANGNIGSNYVARAQPDGHTLLLVDLGNLTISPSVYSNMPFHPLEDLTGIAMLGYSPHLLVTSMQLPVKTQEELVDYAKAHPGEINFAAAAGIGSAAHMAGVLFAQKSGIEWNYIPYKGGAQAMTDLVGGQVDATTNGMVATYPHVKNGKIRLLAVTSEKRLPQLPDVPAVSERIPGFVTGSWQGILAPANTPAPIIETLNTELNKIVAMPDIRERMVNLGAEPMHMTPTEFNDWMRTQVENWAVVVKEANIRID